MAKISIIIPTFNVEPYLVECMDSVTKQTLSDIEIICINDGSTDNSLEILKKYAENDSRIIIVDKENGGYGIGMNVGFSKASGEYIGIVEPDDFVPLNMYEDLYNIAKENELDFVKADFYRFKRNDINGNMELVYNHLSKNSEDYNVVFDSSIHPETTRYIMNTWSGIYRREFIEQHNIRHNETPGASFQDNGFFFQTFMYAKRAMIIDKPYYMNRRDNPNSSVHNKEKVYCMNVEYDYIKDLMMKDKEVWERYKSYYWLKKYSNYMFTIKRIGNEHKREYIMRFSQEFHRGIQQEEIDKNIFTALQWDNIQFLIKDPEGFYYFDMTKSNQTVQIKKLRIENKKLKAKLKSINNSFSFKVGRAITFIPRKVIRIFK